MDEMKGLPPASGLTLTRNYGRRRSRAYAMELGDWEQAAQLRVEDGVPWAQAITWTAIGVGSARSKNLEKGFQTEQKLAALRDSIAKQNNSYWSNQVEVERREVAALEFRATEWRG